MKKTFLFIILLLCSSISMLAQQQHENRHFNPEEFRAKLEDFIGRKAGFSSTEAQAFFPIYHEMKGKQRGIQHKIFGLKKNAPAEDANETEYAIIIQKINDLGVQMAERLHREYGGICLMMDPPVVDELQDLARITGVKGIYRRAICHALNLKAAARKHAQRIGRRYEDLNLIVCHIDGGISITAHEKGRMIDGNDAGGGEIYSRYITSCQTSTELEIVPNENAAARKILVGGQLYIVLGEQLFNIQGQRVK